MFTKWKYASKCLLGHTDVFPICIKFFFSKSPVATRPQGTCGRHHCGWVWWGSAHFWPCTDSIHQPTWFVAWSQHGNRRVSHVINTMRPKETLFRSWPHKTHPIRRPYVRTMVRLFWVIWRKNITGYRECTVCGFYKYPLHTRLFQYKMITDLRLLRADSLWKPLTLKHSLTLIPAWISNHMLSKLRRNYLLIPKLQMCNRWR